MVDHDPDGYRPRRAIADPESTPPVDPRPAVPDDEDQARPLFREEADGADATTVRPAPQGPAEERSGADPAATEPTRRPLTFVPRRPPGDDEDGEEGATTLLPRTTVAAGGSTASGTGPDDLDDDLEGSPRLGHRTKLALLIGGVAAVVAVGLAVIYAVAGAGTAPRASEVPSASTPPTTSASSADAAALGESSLLDPQGAKPIAPQRAWTVQDTLRSDSEDAPGPACLGTDPLEGAPTPQQKLVRTLAADGKSPPAALHVAQVYASAADAGQAYAVTSKALGSCTITGDYLASGRVVKGAGDEATGSLIKSVAGSTVTGHTVLVSRTGRVLDVVDASQPKQPPNVNQVAKALATVVNAQCSGAGGACANAIAVNDGPPPVGGDEPGFLATGDLPPVSKQPAPWVATPAEAPQQDFTGSSCETVNWTTLPAKDKFSRVYLLQDVPGFFGLNEIKVTTKDKATATRLVDKIRGDWTSCEKRKLTASVSQPVKVTGVGAQGATITGYTATVSQKAGDTTARYRVGIAAAGDQVAFTFLNPVGGLDMTTDQWNQVAVRAVQRATQIS